MCKLVFLQKTIFMAHAPKALRQGARRLATRSALYSKPLKPSSRPQYRLSEPSAIVGRAVRRQQPKAALAVRTKYGGA